MIVKFEFDTPLVESEAVRTFETAARHRGASEIDISEELVSVTFDNDVDARPFASMMMTSGRVMSVRFE